MAKIVNDKYYTSPELAEYCVNKTKEIIGESNIIEYLEPSAGEGIFLKYLKDKPFLAYDIEPENEIIEKQDFLKLPLLYKKGRCVIGNPPFGEKGNLVIQFFNKSIKIGDYVSFILPISQLNNTIKTYNFDLIYSEDLGKQKYSNRVIHCCLNIYKRPQLVNKPNYELKNINIIEIRKSKDIKRNKDFDFNKNKFDLRICAWGCKVGKVLNKNEKRYTKEFIIIIKDSLLLKPKIIELLKGANYKNIYPMTATPNLLQWHIYKYIKDSFPELEYKYNNINKNNIFEEFE